jgi:hypothetical protein
MALAISSGLVAGKKLTPRGVGYLEQPPIVVGLPSSTPLIKHTALFLFSPEDTADLVGYV